MSLLMGVAAMSKYSLLGTQSMLIRARSRDSLRGMIEAEYDMDLEDIVDNAEKDIEIQEYSFEGVEGVLAHG
jgi:hypothetical protein